MTIHNVTYKIEHRARERFLTWMKRIYLPQLLEDGIVADYTLTHLKNVDETDGVTYCLLLDFTSQIAFELYQEKQQARHELMIHDAFKGNYVSFPSTLGVVFSSRG